jgi:glycine cleavage system H protein
MSIILDNLKYAATHEWAKVGEDGLVWVGISDYAQEQLGDVVFIELPELGRTVKAGEACAVIESVKAASDIFSPVSGEIMAVNADLTDAPQWVNEDSHAHWLFKVKAADSAELDKLLTAGEYETATSST